MNKLQLRHLIRESIHQVELETEATLLAEEIHRSSQFLNENMEDLVKKIAAKSLKVSPDDIPDAGDTEGAKDLKDKLDKKGEKVNEGVAITLTLLLPAILELISKLADKIKRSYSFSEEEKAEYAKNKAAFKKAKKEGNKDEMEKYKALLEPGKSKIGKLAHDAGHKLHSFYTSPIRLLLYTFSLGANKDSKLKDKEFREKLANILYCIIMIVIGGVGIENALSKLDGVQQVISLISDGAKGGATIADLVKTVLPKVFA